MYQERGGMEMEKERMFREYVESMEKIMKQELNIYSEKDCKNYDALVEKIEYITAKYPEFEEMI